MYNIGISFRQLIQQQTPLNFFNNLVIKTVTKFSKIIIRDKYLGCPLS